MSGNWLASIPEELREKARVSVSSAFESSPVVSIRSVPGGASGALTYEIEVDGRFYLLRIETRRSPLRNPHQYVCMQIAADAGIAPVVRHADDAAGVSIIDFIDQRPLHSYPGGPASLAQALGVFAAQLQATPVFPVLGDYRALLDRMLNYVGRSCASGLLEPHREGLERIREAYAWDASAHVSSHNDPNPTNILFDGERLWFIDWETSYRNDSLTDIAIFTQNHAPTPELEDMLLRSWLGKPPDQMLRARLLLMRQMTRLYYAGIILATTLAASEPMTDLAAPTPTEFGEMIASGRMKPGTAETKLVLAKVLLAAYRAGLNASDFKEALAIAKSG